MDAFDFPQSLYPNSHTEVFFNQSFDKQNLLIYSVVRHRPGVASHIMNRTVQEVLFTFPVCPILSQDI